MANEKAESGPTKPLPESTPKPAEKVPSRASTAVTEIIPPEIASELRKLGVDPSSLSVSKVVEFSMMFGGPLPHPSILAEYNKAIPGLADKIIAWVEQQRNHRQGLEGQQVNGSERRMNRGQIFGGSVALLSVPVAALVGIFGDPVAAAVIAIVGVGGPTAAVAMTFAFGRNILPKKTKQTKNDSGESDT